MHPKCTICASDERAVIDELLLSGSTSNRRTAAQFQLTETSVRRHIQNHLAPELRKQKQFSSAPVRPGEFAMKLLEIASDLDDARKDAKDAGNTRDLVKLSAAQLSALNLILSRLNIKDSDAAETLADIEIVGRVLSTVAGRNYPLAKEIAEMFRDSKVSEDLQKNFAEVEEHARRHEERLKGEIE